MFWNNTEVNIIKEIDTADNWWWCSSAVLFSVKNGKNTICEITGPANKDYVHILRLISMETNYPSAVKMRCNQRRNEQKRT